MNQNKQEQIETIGDIIENDEWVDFEPTTELGKIFFEFASYNLPRHMGAEDWNRPWAVCMTKRFEQLISETRQEAVEEYLEYLLDCAKNIVENKEMQREYGLIPPMLQLYKMRTELEVKLEALSLKKEQE